MICNSLKILQADSANNNLALCSFHLHYVSCERCRIWTAKLHAQTQFATAYQSDLSVPGCLLCQQGAPYCTAPNPAAVFSQGWHSSTLPEECCVHTHLGVDSICWCSLVPATDLEASALLFSLSILRHADCARAEA